MPRTPNAALTNRFDATSDPTVNDDETQAYDIGSRWVNVDTNTVFECVDATAGAAVWVTVNELIQANLEEPGVITPGGSLYFYGTTGGFTADEVQYARTFLRVGREYGSMRAYVASSTGPTKDIRMGVYDQADPSNGSGVPNAKIRETALTLPSTGVFTAAAFTAGNWTVPESGYYWLAIVRESAGGQFNVIQTNATYPANFLSVRRQTTTGTALPSTTSGLSNPASSVILASLLEV